MHDLGCVKEIPDPDMAATLCRVDADGKRVIPVRGVRSVMSPFDEQAIEGGLRIRRRVCWRQLIWLPTSRVQHTDVSQGPRQRRFGLATLTVHTAGTAGASISLAGLEHGIATRLNDHLRPDRATDAS